MISLERYLRLRIVCADPEFIFSKLIKAGVELLDVAAIDFLTAEITICKRDFSSAKQVLERNSGSFHIVNQNGVLYSVQKVLHRPVLLSGIILFLLIVMLTTGRVYFVNIEGNNIVSEEEILSQAEMCGLKFGVKAVRLRSEEVKNHLLSSLPELQWLGITTSGTVATIHVKERSIHEETVLPNMQSIGIYASRDGVISEITVEKGTPVVQIGQRVKTGDLLVSGYTDCGLKLRVEMPAAEVFAHTNRKVQFITPSHSLLRGDLTQKQNCFKVKIGKKVINLCNHSGIPDGTCVKMYEEDYWTLPGGFRLPVSVIHVTQMIYETKSTVISDEVQPWLPQYARSYLCNQMVAGEILNEDLVWKISDDISVLAGTYACHEMIGQVMNEEIIDHNAEDN